MDEIYQHFNINQKIIKVSPFGSGHINDTYRLSVNEGNDYLLQRINHNVFHNVPELMDNIVQVTQHIKHKITKEEALEGQTTLNLIQTVDGNYFHNDADGNYWRVYDFLESLKSYDLAESSEQVFEGAKSFGGFLKRLSDFSIQKLHTTIPRFNDVFYRLDNLRIAVNNDSKKRKLEVKEELDYVNIVTEKLCEIEYLKRQNRIPIRVTHNDTKFNNVMFGEDNKGKCVIDLDTVMPGIVHYDFGDGIRTTASTVDEDEADLGKIDLDMEMFKAFSEGYLDSTRNILTPLEIQYLGLSAPLFSFIMGIRFLTDYLSGDIYYKTDFEGHNLQRARCQLELTKKMLERLDEMNEFILSRVIV